MRYLKWALDIGIGATIFLIGVKVGLRYGFEDGRMAEKAFGRMFSELGR